MLRNILLLVFILCLNASAYPQKKRVSISSKKAIIIAWSYVVQTSKTKQDSDPFNYDPKVKSLRGCWEVEFPLTKEAFSRFYVPGIMDGKALNECNVYVNKADGKILRVEVRSG